MKATRVLQELAETGFCTIKPKGHSMVGRVRSGEEILLRAQPDFEVGDVVFCKVKGNYYLHKVVKKDILRGYLIGNNKGSINGWTTKVYALAYKKA